MNWHTALLILHVLIACALVGIAFTGVVVLFKTDATPPQLAVMKAVGKYGKIFGPLQLIVGLGLVFSEPDKFLHNPLIWTKVILWALASYLSAVVIAKKAGLLASGKADAATAKSLRLVAVALLVVVVIIVALGVTAAELSA